MRFRLSTISDYRTPLMGIAALMIILCHSVQYGVVMNDFLSSLLIWGNSGVDIFLFLSGFGCFYSLSGSDHLLKWYKRRYTRIFVPYIILYLFYLIFDLAVIGDLDWKSWIGHFLTIRFWTHHQGDWFIALLIPLYLVTPLIYKAVNNRHGSATSLIICLAILVLTSLDISNLSGMGHDIAYNTQWAFMRTVSFILGMMSARYAKMDKSINPLIVIPLFAAIFIGMHFCCHSVFNGWCITVPAVIICCLLCQWCTQKHTRLYTALSFMGTISLESYLTNVGIKKRMPILLSNLDSSSGVLYGHYVEYLFVIAVGLILSWTVHKSAAFILKRR
ncbi:MAG: acyltransferase [Bacteroidales bacterium]|nr:acyltransferase [Bacteroidales bacterium]